MSNYSLKYMALEYNAQALVRIFNRFIGVFLIWKLSSFDVQAQSIVINEVSQGVSGNQEYVEFLVTGPALLNCSDTPPCIDLRGYIFDDNNGFLNGAPTTGVGIAAGACRFSNDPFWSCIPAGTLIVVYNDADPNTSLTTADLSMSDGNCMLNVPVSSALFERHTTLPSSSSSAYSAVGWLSGGNWTNVSMANAADGFQIYAPSNTTTPVFSIGWGPTNNLGNIYMGSGSAAGNVFFANACDYFNQASWIDGAASTDQTPGFLNAGQSACVGLMNANCDPPTVVINPVNESCTGACDGSATATVSGGTPNFVYLWSPAPGGGQGTSVATGLCAGGYTLTITNDNGAGCVLTENVTIASGSGSTTPTFAAVAPICSGDVLAALPTTSTNGFTGSWSPALNNTTTTTYTFTPTSGQCAATTTLTITVNPAATPTFAAVAPICSGDVLVALPTTSTNGFIGTWSPALNNTATTTYTFTPSSGQCAIPAPMTILVNPTHAITMNDFVCAGSDYTYPDGFFAASVVTNETHVSFLSTTQGCDSVITTVLAVIAPLGSTTNTSICQGSDYTFPDGTTHFGIASAETYLSTLTSASGCDSIVTTNLTVNPNQAITENNSACENTTYFFPDGSSQLITASTSHVSNLLTLSGCDSVITTHVAMIPGQVVLENVVVCENTPYVFPDGTNQVITGPTVHVSHLFSVNGCDSSITTTISVNPSNAITENIAICYGSGYAFPDGTVHAAITADESYTSNFTNVSGCDSLVTTVIHVQSLPVVQAGADQLVCDGESVTLSATGALVYSWTGGITNGVAFLPALQSQTYTVTGTDALGCHNTDDVQVDVTPILTPYFQASAVTGCAPLEITFENLTSGGIGCTWSFGDGSTVTDCSAQNYSYTNSGLYDVTLTITDAAGCTYTNTLLDYITVYEAPQAAFFADQYTVTDSDAEVDFTNNSSGADWYAWRFGDNTGLTTTENPTHVFPFLGGNTVYWVTLVAGNINGCTDTADAYLYGQDEILFYVPNVFTPDGDEFNEIFQPVFTSGFDPYDFHLMIFNRWGEIVFESFNALVGWNGTYSDQDLVQDDVYIWKIDFRESMSDKRHEYTGHVTVLK